MMDMVLDPKFFSDQIADPGASPQVCRIPRTLGSLEKALLELALLANGQLGRTAGRRSSLYPAVPLLEKTRLPAAHGSAVGLDLLGDFYGSESFLKQCDCLNTTLFQLGWAAEWSHA